MSPPTEERVTRRSSRNRKHDASTSYDTPAEIPDELNQNNGHSHERTHDQVTHDHATSHNSLHTVQADNDDDIDWHDPAVVSSSFNFITFFHFYGTDSL